MMVSTAGKLGGYANIEGKSENGFASNVFEDLLDWQPDEEDGLVDTLFSMPIFESGLIDFSALLWGFEDDLHHMNEIESALKNISENSGHDEVCFEDSMELSSSSSDAHPSPPLSPDSESPKFQDKVRLYEFVIKLLTDGSDDCVRWVSRKEGEFEITNTARIASLWGSVKRNPTMTYEKFARALRHYYKLGILVNFEHKEKLRYKFSDEILSKKL